MKTKISFNALLLLLGVQYATAQAPAIEWQQILGGTGNDIAYSVQQTTDGGYIVAGESGSNDGDVTGHHGNGGYGGFSDYWVAKLNSLGIIEWEKSLGGTNSDIAYSIQQTTDGGYIVAGSSSSIDGDVTNSHLPYGGFGPEGWVVKLNNAGNIEWEKSLGATTSGSVARSIQQTSGGGYIVAGYTGNFNLPGHHGMNDYWVIKLNETGNMEWQKVYGGSNEDRAHSIQQTTDGGYIVAGYATSNNGDVTGNHSENGTDYWVVKLNGLGNIEWQKALGGTRNDEAQSVQQTTDGGYIVVGESFSSDGDVTGHHGAYYVADFWVVKLNGIGVIEWQKSIGGTLGDRADSVRQTTDGGYIVAGDSGSNDGDANGNGSNSSSDYWVVKLNNVGSIEWQKEIGSTANETAHSVWQTADGGYILAGGNPYDYKIVKLSSDNTAGTEDFSPTNSINIYPNPIAETLFINSKDAVTEYQIYSLEGRKLISGEDENLSQIDVSKLSPGNYIVKLKTKDGEQSYKIIKK